MGPAQSEEMGVALRRVLKVAAAIGGA